MVELNGMKLTDQEFAEVLDSYLGNLHCCLWGAWDIQSKEGKPAATAFFIKVLEELREFMPKDASYEPKPDTDLVEYFDRNRKNFTFTPTNGKIPVAVGD